MRILLAVLVIILIAAIYYYMAIWRWTSVEGKKLYLDEQVPFTIPKGQAMYVKNVRLIPVNKDLKESSAVNKIMETALLNHANDRADLPKHFGIETWAIFAQFNAVNNKSDDAAKYNSPCSVSFDYRIGSK